MLGRDRELARLWSLVDQARQGRSGAVVVSGVAGVGKTALLDALADRAGQDVRVVRMIAAESEVCLPYAGLELLCGHLMEAAGDLPEPQRQALETAFGVRDAGMPNPLVMGLAVRNLLANVAAADDDSGGGLVCVVDDAHWLDDVSARALASVARRLGTEGVAIVFAMREVDEPFTDLPQLRVEGLGDDDARALLGTAFPGALDERVRDQLIADSAGNPLALRVLPRSLSPTELAGGFGLARSMPLQSRIEESILARTDLLAEPTRRLLLLAAADPTGDPGLLWRASAALDIGPEHLDAAEEAGALVRAARVSFSHPLVRSAVYRAAQPEERRLVHAALADATYVDRDPDRRAWHRANATVQPDEEVASDLETSAVRARSRGGAAAAAAFLERAAELTPEQGRRVDRLIAAATAKHDAGAPEVALRLLDSLRDEPLAPVQEALTGRVRARAHYALRRDRRAPRMLLHAARRLEPHDPALARDTYIEALSAAVYAGRLGEPGAVTEVAEVILEATEHDSSERAQDLILRGQALLYSRGPEAALPTVRRALKALVDDPPGASALHWMWFGARTAQDVWDTEALRTLTQRQVEIARAGGVVTVLPMALSLLMVLRTFDGDLDAAEAICDDIDAILAITGHAVPQYGRLFIAAYRGHLDEVERRARQLREDAYERGEAYALTAANMAEALAYNGAGRYAEALAAGRGELPYADELGHAMRTLLEIVEAAVRVDERAVAQEALERLERLTQPVVDDSAWAHAVVSLARAQLLDPDEAEACFQAAIDDFDRIRVPMLRGRSQLLYGEMLRRAGRRVDARAQLRAAYAVLSECGLTAFAERAQRELRATGETLRTRGAGAAEELTDQELNVARLAREGCTNREIGARLFISAHTAEWHLRKVYAKLGIRSRNQLQSALSDTAS
ncbi:UNVERIFIED_CONTAM: LuxR family transcriptional regulator [Mumia flava]